MIIVVNIILLIICLMVGAESGHIGMAFCMWAVMAVVSSMCLQRGEWMNNTDSGREQCRREQEQDNKEWNEWRYAEEDKDE